MSNQNQTIYCGSGKVFTTKYGELTKLSFSKKDLETMLSNLNDKGWVTCVLKEKKEKVEGKPTHSVSIDTWKPKEQPKQTNNDKILPF